MLLTVAIATWNRAELLRQTLESLLVVRCPAETRFELLVCDNHSTDDTKAAVESFAGRFEQAHGERFAGPVRYVFEPQQGKSHALNRLVVEAAGTWVLFLDDDVRVSPQWLEAYGAGMARYPRAGAMGGAILPWLDRPVRGRSVFLIERYPAVFSLMPLERDTPMRDPAPVAGGPNMALKRELAAGIGFDTSKGMFGGKRVSGEDVGIVRAVLRQGHEGWLLSEAQVSHYIPAHALGTRRLWQWMIGIGRERALRDGPPAPGRFGVPWWAWRRYTGLWIRMAVRWRPWPDAGYFDAVVDAAQYWGYLRSR